MRPVARGPARWLYLAGGLIAVGLGLLGIVTPVLPTTPFLLLAAFCLSRSSPERHAWLRAHPTLGGPLRDWERGGVIRPPAKRMATLLILLSGGLAAANDRIPLWGKAGLALMLVGVLAFIWSRPGSGAEPQDSPLP